MKRYTVRYAHLKEDPPLKVGDVVSPGATVGTMGSSGQSTGPHLHIDCVEGALDFSYSLSSIESGVPKAAPRQLNYFVDSGLFGCPPVVTTYYADPAYQRDRGKVHYGYDLVPALAGHDEIKWNRTKVGKVTRVANDPAGYGHHIQITFETQET